jgi:hypothetical protein
MASYICFRITYWSVPPIWDARWYAASAFQASQIPFDPLAFSVDGHIAQGLLLPMGLFLHIFRGSVYGLNVILTAMGVSSIWAFYCIARRLLPDSATRPYECAVATAVFAFHPTVLSNMVHFTLDTGLITFWLHYLMALCANRRNSAIIIGVLLIFTKEVAPLLMITSILFVGMATAKLPLRQWLLMNLGTFYIPFCLWLAFIAYKITRHVSPFWTGGGLDGGSLSSLLSTLGREDTLTNFLGLHLILNCNWILIIAWWCISCLRRDALNTWLLALFLLLVLQTCLVRPFSNPRYCVVAVPILILGLSRCIALFPGFTSRLTAFLGSLLLCACQLTRTVDPLSKYFFSSFPFGERELLAMTARTGECCGTGRDQLVYNLEFANIPLLLASLLRDHPTDTLIHNEHAGWFLIDQMNRATGGVLMTLEHCTARTMEVARAVRSPKDCGICYYVALPNFDTQEDLNLLSKGYTITDSAEYAKNRYAISLYKCVPR